MSDKSPKKSSSRKKAVRTLKEKRQDKKAKTETQSPTIPPTGR